MNWYLIIFVFGTAISAQMPNESACMSASATANALVWKRVIAQNSAEESQITAETNLSVPVQAQCVASPVN